MTEPSVIHDFADVDKTNEAESFVRYLDTVSDLDAVRDYKRLTFTMLGPGPGDRLLDLGCGNGADAQELAAIVGSTGHVLGVDKSAALIDEAGERTRDSGLSVEFQVGDGHALAFEDDSFDGCRSDRTFQHLDDPLRALRELVRVTRPGGRVVVSDVDWESLVVDASRPFTRAVANAHCDDFRQGWIGRQLPRLFRAAGLLDIAAVPQTIILTDFALADLVFSLTATAERLRHAGTASDADVAAWMDELKAASEARTFFSSLSGFIVRGLVP
jgi:ubiquinone/menaquinone biosynthesis C-methylase UbiE